MAQADQRFCQFLDVFLHPARHIPGVRADHADSHCGPPSARLAGPAPSEMAGPAPSEMAVPAPSEMAGPAPSAEVAVPAPSEVAVPAPSEVAVPAPSAGTAGNAAVSCPAETAAS